MLRLFKCFSALLLVLALVCSSALAVTPGDYDSARPDRLEPGHLYGKSCIVLNADSGDVLLEKDADTQCYPASTTKIMTCILGLESDLVGTVVTIPGNIGVSSDSSKMGITAGDRMSFNDLLYGMMLASGNDAALAVAILVSGTEDNFVREMNLKAQALGMSSTHYVNPHGLHKVNHYTTARDLATLMSYALQNETFRDIIAATEYTVESVYHPSAWTFTTKYDLLLPGKALYYAPSIGGKTGYHKAAGRCFVGAAQEGNITLVTVTLNTEPTDSQYSQAFLDTIHMSKYGFLQYSSLSFNDLYALCNNSQLKSIKVEKAAASDPGRGVLTMSELIITDMPSTYHELYLKSSLSDSSFKSQLAGDIASRLTFELSDTPVAPISTGDVLGTVYYNAPTGEVLTGRLVAARDVAMEPPTMDEIMDEWIDSHAPWIAYLMPRRTPAVRILYWLALAGIVALIVLRVRRTRRINAQRRRQYELKRREALKRQKQREAYLRAHPEARRKTTSTAKKSTTKR